jgi:hypothetical protein
MSLSSYNEDLDPNFSVPLPPSPPLGAGCVNNAGEEYWLTIRRRCELCKQRKVRLPAATPPTLVTIVNANTMNG